MPRSTAEAVQSGTLYVVATPIGHLEDITLRALKVLKAVKVIAAEDTRRTGILLKHYGITTPLLSVHEHNEQQRARGLVGRLLAGDSVALVSDAGTPAISDPGSKVVSAARQAGARIEPIPGPCAVVAALSAGGMVGDTFTFLGFPPSRGNTRKRWFTDAAEESFKRTVVFFEAPHRVQGALRELALLVEQPILVARELTKLHEEIRQGPASDLADYFAEPRGEFTVVLPQQPLVSKSGETPSDAAIALEFGRLTLIGSRTAAVKVLSSRFGLSRNAIYAAIERAKIG